MIVTEQQRRWWFATHPEYSWSRRGAGPHGHKEEDDEDEESEKLSPEYVDASVDEALRYERDPVGIALLESVKYWFGTEFASKTPEEQYELLWGDEETDGASDQAVDEAADDPWSQQPSSNQAAEPQALSYSEEERAPWTAASPGAFAFLGAGSGWGTPAGAGEPDSSKLTRLEEILLDVHVAKEMALRRLYDGWQAMKRTWGEHIPLPSPGSFPPKPPGFHEAFKWLERPMGSRPILVDPNTMDLPRAAGKAAEDTARIIDATQQLKDAIKRMQPEQPAGASDTQNKIPTIGGRRPINSKYAGQTHPSGVQFTEQGFPDFSPYAKHTVVVEGLTGDPRKDARLANKAAGLAETPDGYTWNHVQDGRTMQLVPTDIHQPTGHTGGRAVKRHGGIK